MRLSDILLPLTLSNNPRTLLCFDLEDRHYVAGGKDGNTLTLVSVPVLPPEPCVVGVQLVDPLDPHWLFIDSQDVSWVYVIKHSFPARSSDVKKLASSMSQWPSVRLSKEEFLDKLDRSFSNSGFLDTHTVFGFSTRQVSSGYSSVLLRDAASPFWDYLRSATTSSDVIIRCGGYACSFTVDTPSCRVDFVCVYVNASDRLPVTEQLL